MKDNKEFLKVNNRVKLINGEPENREKDYITYLIKQTELGDKQCARMLIHRLLDYLSRATDVPVSIKNYFCPKLFDIGQGKDPVRILNLEKKRGRPNEEINYYEKIVNNIKFDMDLGQTQTKAFQIIADKFCISLYRVRNIYFENKKWVELKNKHSSDENDYINSIIELIREEQYKQ